jgi:hypothetical protein
MKRTGVKHRLGNAAALLAVATSCAAAACGNADGSTDGKANGSGAGASGAVIAASGDGSSIAGAGSATSGGSSGGRGPGGGAGGAGDSALPVRAISYWQIGGDGSDAGNSVGVDASENIYVAGTTESALNGPLMGDSDVFVRKLDAQGRVLWTLQLGSARFDYFGALAVETSGNFYLAYHSTDSDSGLKSVAHLDKYDPSGTLLWNQESTSMGITAITVDESNDLYVTGASLGVSNSSVTGYLRKYDASGLVRWTTQFGTPSYSRAVAVDAAGLSYVVGLTDGLDGARLYKLDAMGTVVWTQRFAPDETIWGVTADPSGNVYIADTVGGTPMGNVPDPGHALIRKYDPGGSSLWTRELGNPLRAIVLRSIRLDLQGNAYVVGYAQGPIEGSAANGAYSGFVRKYDSSGGVRWTEQGSVGDANLLVSLAVAASGNVYCSGVVVDAVANREDGDDDAVVMKLDVH